MIDIDVEKYNRWHEFPAFLNQLISYYERNAIKPTSFIDDSGQPIFHIPDEAAISTRGYSIAVLAEESVTGVESMVNISKRNLNRTETRAQRLAYENTQRTQPSISGAGTHSDESSIRYDVVDVVSDSLNLDEVPIDQIKRNELVQWFQDCLACEGRFDLIIDANIGVPDLLAILKDYLDGVDDVILEALRAFDSSKFLSALCSLLGLGTWCIPDLTAFLRMLAFLLQQYWLVDPNLKFNWWNLIAGLLYPILQSLYAMVSADINLLQSPVKCLNKMFSQLRELVEATEDLSGQFGLSLTHLQDAINSTAADSAVTDRTAQALVGKVDWLATDTLIDFADVLSLLDPVEVSILALRDFEHRIDNIGDWLASKLAVLNNHSREALFASMKFTNVMLTIGRLYSFVDAVMTLITQGTKVCREDFDSNGNRRFIPTARLEELFSNTGLIPPWVEVRENPNNDPSLSYYRPEPFTIIDTSLNSTTTSIGCLGRITKEEADRVALWIKELDEIT